MTTKMRPIGNRRRVYARVMNGLRGRRRQYVVLPPHEPVPPRVRTCRVCGCTDFDACPEGCWWVPDPLRLGDLCSGCLQVVQTYPPAQQIAFRRAELRAELQLVEG